MQWIVTYLTSSIGKKQIMGVTGAMVALWILGHMVGNLQLLNPDPLAAQASYNAYTKLLTQSKVFLYSMEAVMGGTLLLHIYLAILLKLQNRRARGPVGYRVDARKGSKTLASFTMILSGLVIAAFLAYHLWSLKFGTYYYYKMADGTIVRDMWLTTILILKDPIFAGLYVAAMVIIGMHLFHAIGSAVQTMGINHQKWTPIINKLSILYCLAVAGGFAFTAVASWFIANMPATQELIQQSLRISEQLGGVK